MDTVTTSSVFVRNPDEIRARTDFYPDQSVVTLDIGRTTIFFTPEEAEVCLEQLNNALNERIDFLITIREYLKDVTEVTA